MSGFDCVSSAVLQEVSQPPRQPEVPPARFGFNDYAERINSRACMVSLCTRTCIVLCFPQACMRDQSVAGEEY